MVRRYVPTEWSVTCEFDIAIRCGEEVALDASGRASYKPFIEGRAAVSRGGLMVGPPGIEPGLAG
jgi:hypothetical protein